MSKSSTEYHEPLILGGPLAPDLAPPQHKHDVRRLNTVLMVRGYKWCKQCTSALPIDAFSKNTNGYYGLSAECRQCRRAKHDPEKHRGRIVRYTYGLSESEHAAMLAAQGGRCAICGGPPSPTPRGGKLRLNVDHDHETGATRGLLCTQCNTGLGSFKDNPALLEQAIAYLEKHRQGG